MLNAGQMIGALATLLLISVVGAMARLRVKSFEDFATGSGSMGPIHVAGTIIGTIVGGASTVGAAQLAFRYGLAGWWFSLGSGFALGFLALFLSGPLRKASVKTIPQYLVRTYGESAGLSASLFTSIGLLLNIIGQVLAATSLLSTVFGLDPLRASLVTVAAMVLYVVYGGVWSTGVVGVVKTVLVLGSMLAVGVVTDGLLGGIGRLTKELPLFPYFSLFGRGLATDLAAAFSLLVGVSSTQTYLQAVFSGRDEKSSRNGTLLAALICPIAGLPGVAVGMYMRVMHPNIQAASALPRFITEYMNPLAAGVILATLFISVIGTAAGLSLGVGVMFGQDVYRKRLRPQATDTQVLFATRGAIFVLAVLALLLALTGADSLILKWSFLSMGLRGSTVFLPLLMAVFVPKRVSRRAGALAIFLAPLTSLLWGVFNPAGIDPLYVGLMMSAGTLLLGSFGSTTKKGD